MSTPKEPHTDLAAEVLDLLLQAEALHDPAKTTARPMESDRQARTARLVQLARDPEGQSELQATRELLGRVRRLSRRSDWSAGRERRLVRSVLAQTTRLDPGWRGDLTLVLSHLRNTFARSSQLRVAAALLFVQCFVVLPALAWVLLKPADVQPFFRTGIEAPPELLPLEEAEEIAVEVPDEPAGLDALERRREAAENVRRRARFLLMSQVGLPPLVEANSPAAVEDLETLQQDLFRERLRLLTGGGSLLDLGQLSARSQAISESSSTARAPEWAGSSARSLLALLALDRGLVLGRSPHLGPLLNELALAEARGEADPLALHVLARARAQGDWLEGPSGKAAGDWDPEHVPEALPLGLEEEHALRALFGTRLESLRGW